MPNKLLFQPTHFNPSEGRVVGCPGSGSQARLLAGVEVREANLGLFVSFWRVARHIARLDLGRARLLAVLEQQ
jgi:hypothetical protein